MKREKMGQKLEQVILSLKKYFNNPEKRIFIYIICGVLLLAVLFGVFIFIKNRGSQKNVAGAITEKDKKAGQSLTFLPDTEREKKDQGDSTISFRDPFAGAVVLKGILTGGGGKDLAIIEAGQTAFIVGLGDKVAGSWLVTGISADAVVLTAGNQELRLEFNGRQRTNVKADTAGNATGGNSNNGKPVNDKAGQSNGNTAN